MRKFGLRYTDWHPHGGHVRADFINAHDNAAWLAVIDKWYRTDQPGQYPENPGIPKPPTHANR
jgi:hypothetical protein